MISDVFKPKWNYLLNRLISNSTRKREEIMVIRNGGYDVVEEEIINLKLWSLLLLDRL